MKSPFQLVSIEETVSRQKHIYTRYPLFKVAGLVSFVLFVTLPYLWAQKYWPWFESLFPSKFWMQFIAPVLTGWIVHITSSLVYYILYKNQIPFFEQFKDNDREWPWEYDPEFKEKVIKAIKLVVFNNAVISPIFALVNVCTGLLSLKTEHSQLPSFPVFLCQMVFMMFCEDICFYHSHRFLHKPWIYPHIHKIHHEFYDTICISSEYAHPVEFLIGNLIPLGMGASLFCGHAHLFTFLMFITLRLLETSESHGGYDFPWALTRIFPFSVSSRYHNYHHLKNIGNFGSFFIFWDSIYGTNSHYYRDLLQSDKDFKEYVPHDAASVKTE